MSQRVFTNFFFYPPPVLSTARGGEWNHGDATVHNSCTCFNLWRRLASIFLATWLRRPTCLRLLFGRPDPSLNFLRQIGGGQGGKGQSCGDGLGRLLIKLVVSFDNKRFELGCSPWVWVVLHTRKWQIGMWSMSGLRSRVPFRLRCKSFRRTHRSKKFCKQTDTLKELRESQHTATCSIHVQTQPSQPNTKKQCGHV